MCPPTSDRSVLLVDDCREHCALTERALRHARPATRCISLGSGDDAIRHLGEGSRPEMLLLDWRMPGRSGEEVLMWARSQSHLQGLPILIVSGVAFPEDRRRATELGANGYLVKPDNLDGYRTLAQQVDDWRDRFAMTIATPATPLKPDSTAARSPWERGERVFRTMIHHWVRASSVRRDRRANGSHVEQSADQLTADLVRLCRAQGIYSRDIIQKMSARTAPHLIQQRRTIIRGLARRGWDTHELAEIFPLTPAAIRLLVRRR